jgi:hypothetical protein
MIRLKCQFVPVVTLDTSYLKEIVREVVPIKLLFVLFVALQNMKMNVKAVDRASSW